ncbi:MAG: FtsX-like permease family protein [Gemmatimonadota bacterium]
MIPEALIQDLRSLAVSVATGILFAVLPAFRASRPDVDGMLKEGGQRAVAGTTRNRLRGALVVSELALSVVLLIGATLMIRSFLAVRDADPGFDPSRLVTLRLYLAGETYDDVADRASFFQRAIADVEVLADVESAAAVNFLPLSGSFTTTDFTVEGQPAPVGNEPVASYRPITSGYFRTFGIPLLLGRGFTEREVMEEGEVVIVNERMAERFWPGERAIGKRIRLGGGDSWQTVVGIAANVHEMDLAAPPEPQLYLPYSHNAWRTMSLAVRTRSSDPARAIPAIRDAIQRLDPTLAHFEIATMEEVVDLSFWDRRLYGWMFSGFAAVALLLAAVGVYGVMAYTVARRTHEIGIRMALGAEARHVIRRVIGQGLCPVLPGFGLGLGLAFGVTRVLAGFLYGVAPTDPLTFGGIALFLAAVALLACYIPARRATRVDPLAALRAE